MDLEEELSVDVSNIFKSIQTACDELTERGQEYLLVSADPVSQSCMKIGSQKGRQFLDVNSEVVINFFSFCFGAEIISDLNDEPVEDQSSKPDNDIAADTTVNDNIQTIIKTDKKYQNKDSYEIHIPTNVQQDSKQTSLPSDSKASDETQGQTCTDLQTPVGGQKHMNIKNQLKDDEQIAVLNTILECSEQTNTPIKETVQTNVPIDHQTLDHTALDEVANIAIEGKQESKQSKDGCNDQQKDSTAAREEQKSRNSDKSIEEECSSAAIPLEYLEVKETFQGSLTNEDEGKVKSTCEDSVSSDIKGNNEGSNRDVSSINKIIAEPANKIQTILETSTEEYQRKKECQNDGQQSDRVKLFQNSKNNDGKRSKKIDVSQSDNISTAVLKTESRGKKLTTQSTPSIKGKTTRTRRGVISPTQEEVSIDTSLSKPTCSVCKATFSRMHSLKGHMLIFHQVEVSLDELRNECNKLKTGISSKTDNTSPARKKQTKNSNTKQKNISHKKSAEQYHLDSTVEVESSISGKTEFCEMSEKCTNEISEFDLITIEPSLNAKNKRKNDQEIKIIEDKKIKLENTDTDFPENENVVLSTGNIVNSLNNTDSDEHYVKDISFKYDTNDIIVLEENHDENIPKIKKEQKKSESKEFYCDICKKLFQRELNLTIHNIRFHPSKIMQQFGVDMSAPISIKQEVVDNNGEEEFEQEDNSLDYTDSQEENMSKSIQDNEELTNNIEMLLEPKERLKEIKKNDQIEKYIKFTETDNMLEISCKMCSFSCKEFHQVLVHIARSHPESSADLDVMMSCFYGIRLPVKKCDECSMTFKSVASLWNHIVQTHPESMKTDRKKKRLHHLIKKYKSKKSFVRCDICKEQFRSMRALDCHMVKHPEIGKRFHCPQCSQAFSTKPNLTRHFKQIHLEEKKFQCDICGRSFKQKETLKYHRTTHQEDKPRNFECHVCHKKLRKKETLQNHLRQHEGIKPYICEFCGMTFAQNGNRNKHVQLVHNDFRPLECKKCGKCFKLQEHLKRHLKAHLIREGEIPADKTYPCEIPGCNARYVTSTQLKIHTMSKHTNERPFSCETCGKGFTTKDKLLRHAQTHLEGLYNCNICHKKLSSQENLNIHMVYHESSTDVSQFEDNYDTVIIPQDSGAPIKVKLSHSEPIITESTEVVNTSLEEGTYYIQTKSDDGNEDAINIDDNTILVDPSVLESVLGATTSDEQTVYYYVT